MDCNKIEQNLNFVKTQLNSHCQLVVVSKYRSIEEIHCVYSKGHKVFGENRVQALLERKDELPQDIKWHLIGHLQRNKVKYIAPFIDMIHSVDSFKLLKEINKHAQQNDRIISCLLQVHIAKEETKFGFSYIELHNFLNKENWQELKHIKICGLMAMATNTTDQKLIANEFNEIQTFFNDIKTNFSIPDWKELSIGMSSDYQIAIEKGSTMVRVGSKIFN